MHAYTVGIIRKVMIPRNGNDIGCGPPFSRGHYMDDRCIVIGKLNNLSAASGSSDPGGTVSKSYISALRLLYFVPLLFSIFTLLCLSSSSTVLWLELLIKLNIINIIITIRIMIITITIIICPTPSDWSEPVHLAGSHRAGRERLAPRVGGARLPR